MGKGIITKSRILWVIFTLVATLFSMASIQTDGIMSYVYFSVAIASCYGIRMFAKRDGNKDDRK